MKESVVNSVIIQYVIFTQCYGSSVIPFISVTFVTLSVFRYDSPF